jgi:hypothetical protein
MYFEECLVAQRKECSDWERIVLEIVKGICIKRYLALLVSPPFTRLSLLAIIHLICTVHADGVDRLTARLEGRQLRFQKRALP